MELEEYRFILQDNQTWFTAADFLSSNISSWLLHQGSLTEKLQQKTEHLNVRLVQQCWSDESIETYGKDEKYWLREVILRNEQQDWIFAQTFIPQATIQQVASHVPSLGETPIGLWLFQQTPKRLSLEWRQAPDSNLYARRSLLDIQGYQLQIKELFLPNFPFD